MLNDCPDPKEVSDFHFLQLKTLRIIKEDEQPPSKPVNLVTSASKYDLLFVGVKGGFKILKLDDILVLEDDKDNRSIFENYSSTLVSCDTPILLAVNATQTVLAVCSNGATGIVLMLYSLSNFSFNSPWQPFCSKVLSPSALELRDFVWNPALECLYAFCLSDGSLHIHELSQNTIKPTASVPNASAQAICWSPKGKQLVVGKQDGSFSQYKPNLDVVSTVQPPALDEGPLSVTSICWISTTIFAVVYVANDMPNLFIVSTPKGATVTYTNFSDICLGNNSAPDQKYLMHFEPSWGLLICASFDSIEIAVLGSMPNLVQWDLKEDGKALLPGKNGALNAVGMSVMYSAQKQIIISDSVSYPPMPVMFLLTNNGLLVSFHMVNERTDAPTLVSAPLPVDLKMCSATGPALENTGSETEQKTENKSFFFPAQPLVPPSPITEKSAVISQMPSLINMSLPEANENIQNLPGTQKVMPILNKPEALRANSTFGKNSQLQKSSGFFTPEKENQAQSNTENSYMKAVISEIQSFEKELHDLKQLQNSVPTLGTDEDMSSLKIFASNLQNFQNDISETMQSLSSDIYTLKNVLLESFVFFEEASSRERRRNDHSYITMLKERSLDPITAKHMQKLHQLFQYINTQLLELNNKLDQDRILHMSNKKNLKNNYFISSTEAIYKTIVNNQKIIHNLRKEIDMLSKKAEAKKLKNITNSGTWFRHHKRLPHEDLSKLADEFLQVKIDHEKEEESTVTKKLSSESQNFLKDFLKKSTVVTVRPTAVYSPSQSRLLSNTLPSEHSGHEQTLELSPKDISSDKEISKISTTVNETVNETVLPNFSKESTPIKPYFPVYEPITPPDIATSTPEPVNKTFSYLLKENNSEPFSHPSSTSSNMNLNQGIFSSGLPSVNSNKDFPKFSFTSEIKSSTSEAVSSPLVFPKTFSFASSAQKDSQPSISKPLAIVSSSASQPVSGFQFGQKVESFWCTSNVISLTSTCTSTSKPELNNASTENSKLIQPNKTFEQQPDTLFKVPTFNKTNSILSESKTSSVTTPPVQTGAKKLVPDAQGNGNFSILASTSPVPIAEKMPFPNVQDTGSFSFTLPMKNNKGFFFESNKNEQAKQDDVTTNVDSPSGIDLSFTSTSFNKTISAPPQLSSNQKQNTIADSVNSTNKFTSSNILSNQGVMNTVLKNDSVVDNQSDSAADLSTSKQPVPTSDTQSMPVISSSSNSVIESTVSTVIPSLTSTAVSSVIPTETVTSHSSLSVSKPPSPPLTAVPPVDDISSPSTILFGHIISTASTVDSKIGKSETITTSSDVKQAQIIEKAQSETPSSITSPKIDPSTSNETSVASFGQQPTLTTVPQVTPLSQPASTSDAQTVLSGQPAPTVAQTKLFSEPSTTVAQTTLFGQPVSTAVTQTPLFGQPTSASNFSSTAGGFFSQTPTFGAADATAVTTATSDFSNQSSTFSFAKPAFGQTTGSFGLAKSFFGQNPTPFTQAATPSSFSFNQNANTTFGQGSFFSGLGGKPSEENANKNVFGISSGIKSDSSNLFKNSSVKSFGAPNGSSFTGTGGFSSGAGSVAQSGFGSFQQSPSQLSGGFGAAPTFGSSPAFGSPPAFGGSPAFGSGNAMSPAFGQQQVSSNFSNFANASSPTFGSLASQNTGFSSPPSFGSPAFGSAPAFGTTPSFGGQSPSFGNPSTPPGNASAFTQWRN